MASHTWSVQQIKVCKMKLSGSIEVAPSQQPDITVEHYKWLLKVFLYVLCCGALWLALLNCANYKHPYSLTHSLGAL